MMEVLQLRLSPDEARFGVATTTTSTLLIVCGDRNIALWACKYPIHVGTDRAEGHCVKANMSISMVTVLERGISPDDAKNLCC